MNSPHSATREDAEPEAGPFAASSPAPYTSLMLMSLCANDSKFFSPAVPSRGLMIASSVNATGWRASNGARSLRMKSRSSGRNAPNDARISRSLFVRHACLARWLSSASMSSSIDCERA